MEEWDSAVPLNAQYFHLNVKILSHNEHLSWTVFQSQQKEPAFKRRYTICDKEELPQQCKEAISRYKGEQLVVIIIVMSHCYQLHKNFYLTFFLKVNSIGRWNYWLSSVWIFSNRSTTAFIRHLIKLDKGSATCRLKKCLWFV